MAIIRRSAPARQAAAASCATAAAVPPAPRAAAMARARHAEEARARADEAAVAAMQRAEAKALARRERAERFPLLECYPTVADALMRGTDSLDVDGVLIVAEHGDYPDNEKGQTLWPRYEFFKQMLAVFRASGRSVPVFNDKHLS